MSFCPWPPGVQLPTKDFRRASKKQHLPAAWLPSAASGDLSSSKGWTPAKHDHTVCPTLGHFHGCQWSAATFASRRPHGVAFLAGNWGGHAAASGFAISRIGEQGRRCAAPNNEMVTYSCKLTYYSTNALPAPNEANTLSVLAVSRVFLASRSKLSASLVRSVNLKLAKA